jgi:S-adenosylmethionine synthetase
MVNTFGTAQVEEKKIEKAVKDLFDLTPAGIVKTLDLKKSIYQKTASYGHFGRDIFSWEKTDKAEAIKKAL